MSWRSDTGESGRVQRGDRHEDEDAADARRDGDERPPRRPVAADLGVEEGRDDQCDGAERLHHDERREGRARASWQTIASPSMNVPTTHDGRVSSRFSCAPVRPPDAPAPLSFSTLVTPRC